jgi:hypothetical protein
MGFWNTIMSWFSSGAQVLLWKFDDTLKKSKPVIKGAVLVKGDAGKTVISLEVKVVEEHSYPTYDHEGKEKTKTDTNVLGMVKFPGGEGDVGFPLEFKEKGEKEQVFTVPFAVTQRLRDHATSTMGHVMAFGSSEKTEYYLVAEASVKGSILGASAKELLKVIE